MKLIGLYFLLSIVTIMTTDDVNAREGLVTVSIAMLAAMGAAWMFVNRKPRHATKRSRW